MPTGRDEERKDAPEQRPEREAPERPRTDLPPERGPYYEGYFGTEEEEGVVREREASGDEPPGPGEDSAGGDREI